MFLKVVSDDERLLEVWVKVILQLLCLICEYPVGFCGITLAVEMTDWIWDTYEVHIFEIATANKQLDFVAQIRRSSHGIIWLHLLIYS